MMNPNRIVVRLVLNWKVFEIISWFCATLSSIGCTCIYMYVCMYIHIYIYMYVHIYTYTVCWVVKERYLSRYAPHKPHRQNGFPSILYQLYVHFATYIEYCVWNTNTHPKQNKRVLFITRFHHTKRPEQFQVILNKPEAILTHTNTHQRVLSCQFGFVF